MCNSDRCVTRKKARPRRYVPGADLRTGVQTRKGLYTQNPGYWCDFLYQIVCGCVGFSLSFLYKLEHKLPRQANIGAAGNMQTTWQINTATDSINRVLDNTFLFELSAQTGFHSHPCHWLICRRGIIHHKDNSLAMGGILCHPLLTLTDVSQSFLT